jgi:putative hydrolase of the HAD superfamily
MNLSRIGVIFDGDDTLWETQLLYALAKRKFFRQMERLGFDPIEAEERFERIDVHNVRLFGFSKGRFPRSMSDTYRLLSGDYNKSVDKNIKKQVEAIGYSAFGKKPRVFPGVTEVLRTLRAVQLKIILATKGDQEVQEEKISFSNLRSYFDRIYIFPEKRERDLIKIVNECNLDVQVSWSIGNSIKSDINPALKIGMRAIWIPKKTWGFEEGKPLDKKRLFKVRSIKEVPKVLQSQMPIIRT